MRHKRSAKIVGADRRKKKEQSFLDSLLVQADNPDSVLDDRGSILSIKTIAASYDEQGFGNAGISFVLGECIVSFADVQESLRVISECAATIERLTT